MRQYEAELLTRLLAVQVEQSLTRLYELDQRTQSCAERSRVSWGLGEQSLLSGVALATSPGRGHVFGHRANVK